MKYLITSSLLDGLDWYMTCPKNWKESAKQDFISMIRREKRPVSEACQRGIDFENLVCKCNEMDNEQFRMFVTNQYFQKGFTGFQLETAVNIVCKMASIIKGGKQQVRVMKDMVFGDNEYHLFGYIDVLFPNKIVDIKTTKKYTEGYNYVKRSQHYIYSFCTGINIFEYLVADYKETSFPCSLKRIEFEMTQDENKWVLEKRINDLFSFLKENNLFEDYCNIFTLGHNDNERGGK